ncbi:hypothetical protein NECAME_13542 [Necator americanus]|uniref:Endonuclease/exonuclease/phosphatase family protein n=1 Tax=Necator americanus TaxID=51031 RepID=W2SX38_NECAM|nr:hypothetical protein NECAME_13542 [Necator americanus]ETN73396.1 hypothetical protein NECAME_13542 [Necator americanus]
MAICTYNARTLASEAAIEDLMMQAKKIKYDVIGLTETRRRHPLNAVYETGEELFLGTSDSRGVGGVGVLVNTSMVKNMDSIEQLTTRIGHSAMDNIDEEHDRFVEHLHDCAKKAESSKTTKRRLSLETLELIRQRGAARAAGNQELTSELARLCREAIKEDLKEKRAEVSMGFSSGVARFELVKQYVTKVGGMFGHYGMKQAKKREPDMLCVYKG